MGLERDVIVLVTPGAKDHDRLAWSAVASEDFWGVEIAHAPPYHLSGCTWVVDDTLLAYEMVASDSLGLAALRAYREHGDPEDDSMFRAPGYYRFDAGEARFRLVAVDDSALASRCRSASSQ